MFAVEASVDSATSYLWQWQPEASAAWTDLADGVNAYQGQPALDVTGAIEPTLHASVLVAGSSFPFRCAVTNACGSVTSDVATLTILDESDPACAGCPACPADFDNNGGIDGADLASFFFDYEAGEGCADVNNNGGIDGADLAYFFTAYEAGGC